MKSKEQIELEELYSTIDNKTINEMSGFQPEEANSFTSGIFHGLVMLVVFTLAKMGELKDAGKIDELKKILASDTSLKSKFMQVLRGKSLSQSDINREKMGLPILSKSPANKVRL